MRSLPWVCLLLASPSLAAAPAPGYARAEDYLEREQHPERYAPANLLDGRDTTAWCSPGGSTAAPITIGFKEPVSVEEVRVYTGDGTSREAFKAHARAKKLVLTTTEDSRSLTVEDKRGLQPVPFNPPLVGSRFTLEVAERFRGAEDGAPVCVTDLVLYSGGKPLNGTFLAPRLKYDPAVTPFLGTWFGGMEGAPERFLSIFADGTWRFSLEPLEGGEHTVVTGTYIASGGRLTLDVPKKGKVVVRLEPRDEANTGGRIALDGALPEEWGRAFRNQP
ncbi:discoidin domain-containing protein [Corallococcus sp. M34]|uniref:discoidin domain-containing protein n=1 Tax=Citreicoccus inhibens TaxID=2849499 RepID=UPI001C2298C0|nr:discoidin domain-containing protein [Citreicoccus inhibens]MBU8897613.1 discoidin domain-containing protein [Citreicoccus inhibens]